jgi:hypothetical protein
MSAEWMELALNPEAAASFVIIRLSVTSSAVLRLRRSRACQLLNLFHTDTVTGELLSTHSNRLSMISFTLANSSGSRGNSSASSNSFPQNQA